MFGGIIECTGKILHAREQNACRYFTISPQIDFFDLKIGDSVAVNGVCLTVTCFTNNSFEVTAVPETLRLTNLAQLNIGCFVNLERALPLGARLGGHFVQGHIDGIGKILEIKNDMNSQAWIVKISLPQHLANYVVPKGYIGLDGMSITVIHVTDEWFTVTFIPHTQAFTITQHYQEGSFINIEVDVMGKYIEKLIGAHKHVICY